MFEVLVPECTPSRASKYSAGLQRFISEKTGTYCGGMFDGIVAHVKGFEGVYLVSTHGSIYSVPRNGTKKEFVKLKTKVDRGGYVQVILSKNDKKHYKTIHRLVASTFIENPLNKPQVNHKNGDKENNSVYNLEWNTVRENKLHAVKNGLAFDLSTYNKKHKRKLSTEQVKEIHKELSAKTMKQKDIAKKYGVCKQTITNIKQGNTYV